MDRKVTTYLVTGGAGFIGSNIAETLVKDGHRVKVLDNFDSGRRDNLEAFKDDIEICEGDIRDLDYLMKVTKGVDYISHQAAVQAVPRSVDNPLETNDVNVNGMLNVLMAARDNGVKRLVWASSASVYGNNPDLPKLETMKPEPMSPYAATKLIGEHYAKIFSDLYDLETVSLRYFNVFGPRQNLESIYSAVIPIFIDEIHKGHAPDIHGDGEQSRDLSYIDNVVSGNLLAFSAKDVSGEILNIACGERFSVNDIFRGICKFLNKDAQPNHTASRPGDVRHSLAGIGKSEELLNFKVLTGFEEGLQKTVDWFLRECAGKK
jgi:nucleoside-diphosphate-sugar epimerase